MSKPELELDFPRIGTCFEFIGGLIYLRHAIFRITHAEVRRNAAGRPGGRVWFKDERGDEGSVTLSYYREWARAIVTPPEPDED